MKNKIDDTRREMLYAELHALLSAGLDFSHAFALLIDSETDARIKSLLETLYADVVGGAALWQAMERSGSFRSLECGVVRIGEQTGRLSESLDFLRDYYSKRATQRRMISSAISYPLVVLCTAVAVVAFMLTVIVPMFEQVYSRMGGELPAITRWIIVLSKSFPSYLLISATIITLLGGLLYHYRKNEEVEARMTTFLLRLPIVGNILRRHYQAHFCKLLYLLVSSGIPLLEGVSMLAQVIMFYPYRYSFLEISKGLEQGGLFSDNLAKFPRLYDTKLIALIRVGEETNQLPGMLLNQADSLTKELEYRIRRMGSLLEPLLIMLVGVLVAVVLISMYMPMFRLGGIMG